MIGLITSCGSGCLLFSDILNSFHRCGPDAMNDPFASTYILFIVTIYQVLISEGRSRSVELQREFQKNSQSAHLGAIKVTMI
jgi:hypothetical protein